MALVEEMGYDNFEEMHVTVDWVLWFWFVPVLFAQIQLGRVSSPSGYRGFCGQLCQHRSRPHSGHSSVLSAVNDSVFLLVTSLIGTKYNVRELDLAFFVILGWHT